MSTTASFIPPEIVLGTTTSWLPVTTAYPSVSGCADAFFLFPGQPGPVSHRCPMSWRSGIVIALVTSD